MQRCSSSTASRAGKLRGGVAATIVGGRPVYVNDAVALTIGA